MLLISAERILGASGNKRNKAPFHMNTNHESLVTDNYKDFTNQKIDFKPKNRRRLQTSQRSRASMKYDITSKFSKITVFSWSWAKELSKANKDWLIYSLRKCSLWISVI